MRNLRPSSILLGVLVDKTVFIASALTLSTFLSVSSPPFPYLALACGLGSTLLGGFTAACLARAEYLPHGLAVGAMAVAISFGRFVVNSVWPLAEAAAQHPLWWELLGWTGALLAGLTGGWFVGTIARRSLVRPSPRSNEVRWGLWLPVFLAVIAIFAFAEHL
jgi:hypothetical protein